MKNLNSFEVSLIIDFENAVALDSGCVPEMPKANQILINLVTLEDPKGVFHFKVNPYISQCIWYILHLTGIYFC